MAKRTLLELAEDYERRAQVLRLAHAEVTGDHVAAAKAALPATLRAASRLRARAVADTRPERPARASKGITRVESVLRAIANDGPLTHGDVARAIQAPPSGVLTVLAKRGYLSASPSPNGLRYTITKTGRARLKANGAAPAPKSRKKSKPRKVDRPNDPPTALRGSKLTAFLLGALNDKPQGLTDLVSLLQAVGHPIDAINGIAGPMGKITAAGWLRRNGKGIYHITPKGARRIKSLEVKAQRAAAKADRAHAHDAAAP